MGLFSPCLSRMSCIAPFAVTMGALQAPVSPTSSTVESQASIDAGALHLLMNRECNIAAMQYGAIHRCFFRLDPKAAAEIRLGVQVARRDRTVRATAHLGRVDA